MHRNFMEPMVDAHYTVRDRGAHRLADQPPRHRIGIAIDLHRTIALHAPDQLARRVEGRNPGNQLESFGLGADRPIPTRTSATSRVQASRCASKASQLGKLRPAIAFRFT